MSFDVLIVGSGPAGVAAATAVTGRRVGIVDVGTPPPAPALRGSFYELREHRDDLSEDLLGGGFESLENLFGSELNVKLKGPRMRFVTRDWGTLSPVVSSGFAAVMSFARGGLANAWGAGVFRFTDRELEGFPFDPSELAPHYESLTRRIGISGCADDLTPFFGSAEGLDPPLAIDAQARLFLRGYERHRRALNAAGFFVGRPRLAVVTRDRDGREPYPYEGLDFFEPGIPAVYNPAQTLAELRASGQVEYLDGRLALRYEESVDGVVLRVRNLRRQTVEAIDCRRLLLAAGALNSAKLVLASNDDHETRLPILDNPISYVPLLAPTRIGRAQERRFFPGGQLSLVHREHAEDEPVQGSFYGMSGILRSEFLMELPLAASAIVAAARDLAPALAMVQLFYADEPRAGNDLRWTGDDALEIRHAPSRLGHVERRLLRAVRRLGYLGLPRLCQYPPPGSSFHYAGTLPMRARPEGPYETTADGRLSGTRSVYVCDAATFPRLPAKNLTFTAMANAMRIATRAAASLPR